MNKKDVSECELSNKLAKREGVEPSVDALNTYDGLANRYLRPLGHLSAFTKYSFISKVLIT
jgi:hypothetical protein